MILFVGLGNPGDRYQHHRHNIGFLAVDEIGRRHAFRPERHRFDGGCREGEIDTQKILILKPATFMNESGRSVGQAVRYYKIPPAQVIVFHDELDLVPGKVRVKTGGGSAGHNGLRSLDAHIGPDYRRVRLGIGHPGDKNLVHRYVLHDFDKADNAWLEPLLAALATGAPLLAAGDDPAFMSKVALLTRATSPGSVRGAKKSETVPKGPTENA